MKQHIEDIVEEFYSTFAGNKFEASYKVLKQNNEDKVEAFFMEDWLRAKFTTFESQIRESEREERNSVYRERNLLVSMKTEIT